MGSRRRRVVARLPQLTSQQPFFYVAGKLLQHHPGTAQLLH